MLTFFYHIRYYLLVGVVVVAGLLWPGVQAALRVDNSLTVWFLDNDPALVAYHRFQQRFGNDEVVVVVVHDPKTLLTPSYFNRFVRLSDALEALPDVQRVIGPGNTSLPSRDLPGITVDPLLTDTSRASDVRATLANLPTLRQQLFSPDYTTARLLVVLKTAPDFDERRGDILDQIRTTVGRQWPGNGVYLGGVGIIYAALNALSQQDFGFFLGIGYLLMFAFFWFIYRRVLLLVYAVGVVALSTYLTLGLYGALGYRLNLMTVLLPIIMVLLGVMDAIHVINERNQLSETGLTARDSALEALRRVARPCLFTAFTTAAGFLALLTSPMAILKNFGLFAAIGILLCLFFTFLLGAILLPLTQPSRTVTLLTGQRLAHLLAFVLAKRGLFTALSGALMLLFTVGLLFLKTDTYTLGYLPNHHRVVQDHLAMERRWGPYMPLELLVEPKNGQPLYAVEVVRAARAFADSAKTLTGVGRVFGFQSLYVGDLEAQYKTKATRLLGSRAALAGANRQLATYYPELAHNYIHEPTRTGRITVSGTMLTARALQAKMDSLMHLANVTLGQVATVTPAGYQPMYAGIVTYVTQSQVNSLLLSFGLIFGLVWLFIRDARLAALTVIPNLFPVLVMLGMMGWLQIGLDTATASIGAIVLSFCVDDSVHFIYTYQQNRRLGQSPAQARLATITHVGPAIVLTAIVLFSGYILMVAGSLKTVQLWGLLTAIAIVGALYGELILFPLVLERFDRRP